MAWAACLLGNLALSRAHGGALQATLVLGLLALSVPGGLLAGFAVAALTVGRRRCGVGRGRHAGSAIKVATTLVISLGVILTLLAFQLSTWPMAPLFPVPQAGALFFYRAGLALPALGVLAVLSAGLLVVDRPWVVLPALTVGVAADLWLASRWLHRGAGDLGFELAGIGLAFPVAMLLAAAGAGGLLLASARGRRELAIHRGRPFDMGDAGLLVREALLPSVRFAALALGLSALCVLMIRGEPRGDLVGVVMAVLAAGVALVLALDHLGRGGNERRPPALVLASLLGLTALCLLVLPSIVAHALVPGLRYGGATLAGVSLVGAVLAFELVVYLLTAGGWLRRRHPAWVEIGASGLLLALACIPLLALGRHGAIPLVLAILVSRVAVLPALRR